MSLLWVSLLEQQHSTHIYRESLKKKEEEKNLKPRFCTYFVRFQDRNIRSEGLRLKENYIDVQIYKSLIVQLLRSSFFISRDCLSKTEIGERETCMHLIVCRARVGARASPSPPPTCDKRAGSVYYNYPPLIVHPLGQKSVIFRKSG